MKKTLAIVASVSIFAAGCTNNSNPSPVIPSKSSTTSPSASPTVAPEGPTNTPVEPTAEATTTAPEETRTPDPGVRPEVSSSSSEAGTPATEFAQRWGMRYPFVPEYAILKAANGVCSVIDQYPNWTNNPVAQSGITEIATAIGLNENDAVEFAQDAQQNYCASRSNPT